MKEAQVLAKIRSGELRLAPFSFDLIETGNGADALLEANWAGQRWRFIAEIKSRSTPRTIRDAMESVRRAAASSEANPMVIVPYLSEEQLSELEKQNLSGVDLSGNGIVVVPGRVLVFRSGNPNRYPEKSILKNVYSGKVSLAARVFLLRSSFAAVSEIQQEILTRGVKVAISTVSKVLSRLEDDLIVSRDNKKIRLVQPRKLLERLAREYQPPKVGRGFVGKVQRPLSTFGTALANIAEKQRVRLSLSGASSFSRYAVMAREDTWTFYCSGLQPLLDGLRGTAAPMVEETERFANVRLEESQDDTVYFDIRNEDGLPWASPIQSFLELSAGDKRDRETAEQIAERILAPLRDG